MTTFLTKANNMLRLMVLSTVMAIVSIFSANTFAQLDETWTVTVNGQTVQVNPDGSYKISNISADDLFGAGGPGTPPDFVSDDFLRAVAVRTVGGITQYAFSEPFQIATGETFVIGPMTFTDFPPPFPDSLSILVDQPVLTAIGQTAQLTVTGILADGGAIDVTLRSQWTVYRTSNPDIATVGQDGLVTAQGSGRALITAVNEGATAVAKITVSPGDPLTTIEGLARFQGGSPAEAANVNIQPLDMPAITDANGAFQVSNVPTELGALSVIVSTESANQPIVGVSNIPLLFPGGITDAGIITLKPVTWQKATYEGFEYFVLSSNSAEWAPACQALCEELFPGATDSRIDTCNTSGGFFSGGCVQGIVPNVFDANSNFVNYGTGDCNSGSPCSIFNTWQNNVWSCSCLVPQ